MLNLVPDNDYILLTPGPLSTSKRVRAALLKDWCTWDSEYNNMIQEMRSMLLKVANCSEDIYTSVLMQGSGSFSVESVIGTAVGKNDKLLILANGAYGKRMKDIADVLKINYKFIATPEREQYSVVALEEILKEDKEITHVSFVHCETTTGILNPLEDLANVVKSYNKTLIVDAMSSFGGVKIDVEDLGIDFLISSANKCIQGVPGFGFVIAKKESLMKTKGQAKSLSLDLYNQWNTMEKDNGKWRFTSPTHVTHAFYEALKELEDEGGVDKRYERYNSMQKVLVKGMKEMGFKTYVKEEYHSPIITTFLYPEKRTFEFKSFYNFLKTKGFVIYPGKLSDEDTFRIGNIGDITLKDIERLLEAIKEYN
ncbi:MAG: 2-aminoethylphosphonate--pyruvate transaminase [Clostridium sp.]|uniref:2-aminoethylphosphonate--pyruvate transaminase n=1 Tax=Clostridium paraputrificum TaxID=29363 RepID=A0A6N3E046_9CLOT|nr:2-aminoethylphosphonate--pyruvate transaminase [Clostridium sp.]MBS5926202.1 2-aminoethylphosphonate--pyruvate transaminase [Clostridium sp.]MBS5987106.1 2-aminoethylphosphonate--pyruvate transaminase [Clostridium sp.]